MKCIKEMQNLISRLQHTTNSLTPEDIKKFGIGLIASFGTLSAGIFAFISRNTVNKYIANLDNDLKKIDDSILQLENEHRKAASDAVNANIYTNKLKTDCYNRISNLTDVIFDVNLSENEKNKYSDELQSIAEKLDKACGDQKKADKEALLKKSKWEKSKKDREAFVTTRDKLKAANRIGYDKNGKFSKEELAHYKKGIRKTHGIITGIGAGIGSTVGGLTALTLNKLNVKYKLCIKKMNKFLQECNTALQSMKQEVASW